MDTLVVPLLLILVIVLLAAIAAALGWAAHAARSFRKRMEGLHADACDRFARTQEVARELEEIRSQLRQAQSDVAGLKMAERRY